MVNTAYSVGGLLEAVRRELQHAPGMPGSFDDGAKWALGNIEGRAMRADQLHALINAGKEASQKRRDAKQSAAGIYVRGDALVTTRQHGKEFVSMENASRDIGLLLATIKCLFEAHGDDLDAEENAIIDQIATDYGEPRWRSDY